ncbi:ABC transporter substrate-binding protein [Albidovulum sp.]
MRLTRAIAAVAAAVVTAFMTAAAVPAQEVMRMAVTTSFANSGLAEILLPQIEKDTGITVQLLIVGTGQALKLGEQGDVDAVLVHAREAEDRFVAAGHGTHRREIMYNDFVVIGPAADPAGVRGAGTAIEAFADIARARADFVSRGDDSGTNKKERALWAAAGIEPAGDWYKAVGQGMGAALNTAAGLDAYILSDRASWLNFGNKRDLELLFEGDPALFNQYAYIPVNPAKGPHVKAAAAEKLEAWLTSERARQLIDGYRLDGQQLFHFNAKAPAQP